MDDKELPLVMNSAWIEELARQRRERDAMKRCLRESRIALGIIDEEVDTDTKSD
jgi:hypothetical protein